MISEYQYLEFLREFCRIQMGSKPVALTEWEGGFLWRFRASSRPSLWLTRARTAATDTLWRKYGSIIGFPYPL